LHSRAGARFKFDLIAMTNRTRLLKRVLDVVGSSILLVLLAPVIAVCTLLIKLQDGGPVFHRRRVVGPHGEFDAFKLRTMCQHADAILQKDQSLKREFELNSKLRNDPRITRLGALLRKLSFDECPQLWNVLRGEMSLVGPRMITLEELKRYGEAGWIFRATKPGLTGFWQVQGRQEVSFEQRVQMDLFYVRNWSLGLDCKILLKTPWVVVRGVGAY
jgi:lipopolysaccharide/colanic/teichoic acid biosynthesis glycosyltransferase